MMVAPQKTGDIKHDLRIDLEAKYFPRLGSLGRSSYEERLNKAFEDAWERGGGEAAVVSEIYEFYAFLMGDDYR